MEKYKWIESWEPVVVAQTEHFVRIKDPGVTCGNEIFVGEALWRHGFRLIHGGHGFMFCEKISTVELREVQQLLLNGDSESAAIKLDTLIQGCGAADLENYLTEQACKNIASNPDNYVTGTGLAKK